MADPIEQAVILAGGMGTRLQPYTLTHPKPMYPFEGVPFIGHLIEQVKGFGIKRILLLLGYMPEQIMDYLGTGERYGLEITYDITPVGYDTGDRLIAAKGSLDPVFLLMYCDNYCPIDYAGLCADFWKNDAEIQVSVYENKDRYTKSNVKIGAGGEVLRYDKKRITQDLLGVDIGYALVKKRTLDLLGDAEGKDLNFEAEVYPYLVSGGGLFATVTRHRYYSVGSWERIRLTEAFFSGPKTVFLDRDGTLNVRPPKACYIEKPDDFVWIEGAAEAVGLLKEAGYRLILVSNQPGIARERLSETTLCEIHDKMQSDLRRQTGYEIDAIYYCPHNWDDGCDCRKPNPGLLYQAQKDFSLNLERCVLFGDDERDMQAARAAGCRGIPVSDAYPLLKAVKDYLK